jgi:hypothetical protein
VYWPQDRAVKHGPFMIKLDGEVELADYVIRKMTVTQVYISHHRQFFYFLNNMTVYVLFKYIW